jgi:hypothetical protein
MHVPTGRAEAAAVVIKPPVAAEMAATPNPIAASNAIAIAPAPKAASIILIRSLIGNFL